MNVPDGGHTKVNPDGSATVYDKDGNPIRSVARPWAFDAAGRPQKTWYTVDENGDLVQHIEPADNALFPILADPTEATGAAASATAGAAVGASLGSEAPAGESASDGDNAIAGMLTPLVQGGSTANGLGPEAGAPATPTQQPETAPDHIPNAFGVGEQKPESNSDALGDLMNPSFDGSAAPESSEPEFNPYNPLTYPETGQGSDGQTQPDQAQPDALGDLLMPSFDGSDSPESSEPEFNPYNPLTYPDTSQSGDGDGQAQADQAQSDALGELLMPSFTKDPQPEGRVDAPAAGQSMTYTEWLQYTNNQRLDGRVHERVAEDGTRSYYDLSRGPNGEQIERPVTGFGTALENETVYNFGDGTGKTGTGQPAVQDTNGNWWVFDRPSPSADTVRRAVIDGRTVTVTTGKPQSDGSYWETINAGTIVQRHISKNGEVLSENTLDPGMVVGDSSLSEAILSVAIPGGWIGRAGKLAWSLLRKNPEAKKPPRQGTAPRPNAKKGSTERHTSIHETRPEYGTSLPEVLGRGTGGGKKALDQASNISTRLTNKGSPHTTQPVPGPSMTPMPQPGYQYGDIIVGGAIIFAGLVKVFSRMASRWRWPW
ncbi:hypothetical protein [Gordonia sp. MP11Mi]